MFDSTETHYEKNFVIKLVPGNDKTKLNNPNTINYVKNVKY